MSEAERGRLAVCRACGNRVVRDARRCPACGVRRPTAEVPAPSPSPDAGEPSIDVPVVDSGPAAPSMASPRSEPRRSARQRRRARVVALGALLVLAAGGVTAVYVMRPSVSEGPATAPTVSPSAPAAAPPALSRGPSRSRGRTDWLFFFKPGDWLTRMADDGPLGVVMRLEKTHVFADGSTGPAYVVQSIEGEEQAVDADELERSARLR